MNKSKIAEVVNLAITQIDAQPENNISRIMQSSPEGFDLFGMLDDFSNRKNIQDIDPLIKQFDMFNKFSANLVRGSATLIPLVKIINELEKSVHLHADLPEEVVAKPIPTKGEFKAGIFKDVKLPLAVISQEEVEIVVETPQPATAFQKTGVLSLNTREEWLVKAAETINKELFTANGFKVNPFLLSVARPHPKIAGLACQAEHTHHIYLSANIPHSNGFLAVLTHEMVHCCGKDGGAIHGHGKDFQAIAKKVGLGEPWRATSYETKNPVFDKIITQLGNIPHITHEPTTKVVAQKTDKLVNVRCPSCDFFAKQKESSLLANLRISCPAHHDQFLLMRSERGASD